MRVARLASLVLLLAGAAAAARADAPAFRSDLERQSYAVGADLGQKLRSMPLQLDPALVSRGLQDALSGQPGLLDDDAVKAALLELNAAVKAHHAAEYTRAVGRTYLEENGRKPGVVTLASGLQYRVVKPGAGKPPRAGAVVELQWRERLVDGTEVDSSYRRGAPTRLPLDGAMIDGWREALARMPVGATWELTVPPHLAYGEKGSERVGPAATLVYELELVAAH